MKSSFFIVIICLIGFSSCETSNREYFINQSHLNTEAYKAVQSSIYKDVCALFAMSMAEGDASKGGITFAGSSTIALWATMKEDFPEYRIRNRGLGATTIADVISFSEELIFYNKPEATVLYIGDNDAYSIELDSLKKYTHVFIENYFQRLPESSLIFISVKPSPSRADRYWYYIKYNQYLSSVCDSIQGCYYVDVWTSMTQQNLSGFFIEDKLHLNSSGYKVFTNKTNEVLKFIHSK